MTATSRLSMTLFPRLSLCFDLIPSPAVLRHPTLQSRRPPKISEKAAFPYPSHAKIALIPVSSQIMNKRHIQGLKSYYQLSLFPLCTLPIMYIHGGHPILDHDFSGERTAFLAISMKYLLRSSKRDLFSWPWLSMTNSFTGT